jgi:acyl-coenzyme A thioesterase PaaI-like protein
VLDASVLRAGSRSVTIEVEGSGLADGVSTGLPVVAAVLGFSRLERRADNLDLSDRSVDPGTRYDFCRPAGGARPAFTEALAQQVVDAGAGVTLTPVTDYLRNSFGAVNGGVVAAIAAGAALAGAGDGSILEEVAVHHLGQGRHGPVATTTRVALRRGRRTVRRVELRDTGAPDEPEGRLMAVAHVGMYDGPAHV